MFTNFSTLKTPKNSVERMGFLMGTWVQGRVEHGDAVYARHALDEAFQELKRVEQKLSRFLPESAISEINRDAFNRWVLLDEELFGLLSKAQEVSFFSRGALDLTLLPLTELWRAAEKKGQEPSGREIQQSLAGCGYEAIELRKQAVRFQKKDLQLDLGAVGKGYALDQAAKVLKKHGMESAFLNAGGHILCWSPEGADIGIQNPLRENELLSTIFMKDESVATSAGNERFFEIKGRRYGHIMNGKSGHPVQSKMMSVSVVADSAFYADALSTACFVSGGNDAVLLAKKFGARLLVTARKKTSLWPGRLTIDRIELNTKGV